jgi:hypothetical protein
MRKKRLFTILSVVALTVIALVSAAVLYTTLTFNMNATVAEAETVRIIIDGTTYTDGQQLNINWGTVSAGQYTKAITITSTVNVPVTPSVSTVNLPSGWTLTLSDTSPIPAHGSVTRNLVLTVPSNPAVGNPSWTATLKVSS